MTKAGLREFGIVLVGVCLFAGCGKSPGPQVDVSGTVTLDNAPLPNVQVTFINVDGGVPAEHRTFSATTDAQGKYTLPQVLATKYIVTVTDPPAAPPAEPGAATPSLVFAVPDSRLNAYAADRTPLSIEVAEGMGSADFNLQASK